MEKTIEIPEGYEARIDGNKVILEQKESEDERIRKMLIEVVKISPAIIALEHCDEMLAYLEKQKEQKSVQDKNEREYVRTIKSLIADFLRGKDEIDRGYYQKIYDWLDGRHIEQQPSTAEDIAAAYQMGLAEGRKEQKPAEDKDAIEVTPKQDYSGLTDLERAIHRGFLCAGVENVPVGIIKDTAQDCLAQIKPAEWSEEDNRNINTLISVIEAHYNEYELVRDDYPINARELGDWLKSLRHQPKVEWSEEDVKKLAKIRESKSGTLKTEMTFYRQGVRDAFNYKGLRPAWKPSREQLLALKEQTSWLSKPNPLHSLYHQLCEL